MALVTRRISRSRAISAGDIQAPTSRFIVEEPFCYESSSRGGHTCERGKRRLQSGQVTRRPAKKPASKNGPPPGSLECHEGGRSPRAAGRTFSVYCRSTEYKYFDEAYSQVFCGQKSATGINCLLTGGIVPHPTLSGCKDDSRAQGTDGR